MQQKQPWCNEFACCCHSPNSIQSDISVLQMIGHRGFLHCLPGHLALPGGHPFPSCLWSLSRQRDHLSIRAIHDILCLGDAPQCLQPLLQLRTLGIQELKLETFPAHIWPWALEISPASHIEQEEHTMALSSPVTTYTLS